MHPLGYRLQREHAGRPRSHYNDISKFLCSILDASLTLTFFLRHSVQPSRLLWKDGDCRVFPVDDRLSGEAKAIENVGFT